MEPHGVVILQHSGNVTLRGTVFPVSREGSRSLTLNIY